MDGQVETTLRTAREMFIENWRKIHFHAFFSIFFTFKKSDDLDSPAEVSAVPSVPGDVAPPPAGPLHLGLLHCRHDRGGRLLLLLLLVGGGHHLALPDVVDLPSGRHPLRLPLPGPVVLVHGLVGARVENSPSHLNFALAAHLCCLLGSESLPVVDIHS